MLTKRLEVLLSPTVFDHLHDQAKGEGQTVGGYVRQLLDERLAGQPARQKKAALQRLFSSDLEIVTGDWKDEKEGLIRQRVTALETH